MEMGGKHAESTNVGSNVSGRVSSRTVKRRSLRGERVGDTSGGRSERGVFSRGRIGQVER